MSVKNLLIDFDDSASVEDIISRCRTDFLCNVFGRSLEKGSFQWDKSSKRFLKIETNYGDVFFRHTLQAN